MSNSQWSSIKKQLLRFWRLFLPGIKFIFRIVIIGVVLAGAWYGFIWLAGKPPIGTTPALIMSWASVAVVLFAFFPKIIDRVKRVKVKDFELELQKNISQATSDEFILPSDLESDSLFTEKADFRNLQSIIQQADQQPNIPILLVVNIRNGHYISVHMLFTYLYAMCNFFWLTKYNI